jgi:hypothetical protein
LLYAFFLAAQQVHPAGWRNSEAYSADWMSIYFNDSDWSPIQLPSIESAKGKPAYYRGDVELSGFVKPNVVVYGRDNVLEVYVNGNRVTKYRSERRPIQFGPDELVFLDSALFKSGINTVAVKVSGSAYRILGVEAEKTTFRSSRLFLLFLLTPILMFLVLDESGLGHGRVALVVLLVFTLVFLNTILQNFNYWGGHDWDMLEGYSAVPRETLLGFHQIPLWNPFVSGGQPLLADPQSSWLSPLFPVVLVFGVITGYKIQIVLWYVIGLSGMYFLGRHLKLNTYACYLASFAFILTSFYSLHVSIGQQYMVFSMSFAPWCFLFYLKSLEDWRYAALSALMLVFMLFEGGVYTLAYFLAFLALYAIFNSVQRLLSGKNAVKPVLALILIVVLFSALGAVKALPMFELSGKYPRLTDVYDPDGSVYRGYTFQLLQYALLGSTQTKFAPEVNSSIWDNHGAYVGPIVLLLALAAMVFHFKRLWPFVFIAVLGFLIVYGVGKSEMALWTLIHQLPLYSSLRYPSRFILISLFSIAILAGYAASSIEGKRKWAGVFLAILVFYNLYLVDTPAFNEFSILTPRTLEKPSAFNQVEDDYDGVYVYSESYKHFLQNQGVVNFYASLAGLSGVKSPVKPSSSPDYRGEFYLLGGSGTVTVRSFTPNKITLSVNVQDSDYLIVNQNYDSGWKTPGRVILNNDGLLAVEVSPADGGRDVVLYYSPTSFKVGLVVSVFSLVAVFCLARRACRPKGRRVR